MMIGWNFASCVKVRSCSQAAYICSNVWGLTIQALLLYHCLDSFCRLRLFGVGLAVILASFGYRMLASDKGATCTRTAIAGKSFLCPSNEKSCQQIHRDLAFRAKDGSSNHWAIQRRMRLTSANTS